MNIWQFADAHPILMTMWLVLVVAGAAAFGPLVVVRQETKAKDGDK